MKKEIGINSAYDGQYEEVEPIPSLNLPELKELKCIKPKDNDHEMLFYVSPAKKVNHCCPECGSYYTYKHGEADDRIVSDISMGRTRVMIQAKVPRFKCNDCNATFSFPYKSFLPGRQFTVRLYDQLRAAVLSQPLSTLAKEHNFSVATISAILEEVGEELDATHKLIAPRVLGLDEKWIMHKPRAIFVDNENGILLEMKNDNKRDTIKTTIESMEGYGDIEVVTIDMSNSYKSTIKEILPHAYIVVDKFHMFQDLKNKTSKTKTFLMSYLREQVNKIPEEGQRKIKNDLLTRMGKDSYLFKFNEENLLQSEKRSSLMAEACKMFPEINTLRLLHYGFLRIYSCENEDDAVNALNEWRKLFKRLDKMLFKEFFSFRNTTQTWHEEIINYFKPGCRQNNGTAEGLNSLIQAISIQGRGYGYRALRAKALYYKHAKAPDRTFTKKERVFKPVIKFGTKFDLSVDRPEYKVVTYSVPVRGSYIEKLNKEDLW